MDFVIRIALVYAVLMLGFRVLGKRELSKLSPFELVTLLIIPEIVAPAMTAGDYSLSGALVGVTTLWGLAFLNSMLSYRTRWFRHLSESQPAVLVRHGQFVEAALHRERVRADEVYSEMHINGIETLQQVRWAILEPGGKVSFIREDDGETGAGEGDDVE
ncbi:MAG: DUF421 domain-containing protein [Gemmatimonadaceae bacterium]